MDIIKGRRSVITATITQAGSALNLTGYEAELVIGRPGETPILIKAGVISAPATGVITFTLTPADTDDLVAGDYNVEINIWKTEDPSIIYTPIESSAVVRDALDATPVS